MSFKVQLRNFNFSIEIKKTSPSRLILTSLYRIPTSIQRPEYIYSHYQKIKKWAGHCLSKDIFSVL